MQYRQTLRTFAVASALGAAVACACAQAWADGATEPQPLELRKIMQQLGKNMQSVTDGISREDWALVAQVAPRIAEHPQPPIGERMRILTYVGADMGRFKGYDEQTHKAARALEDAAARSDGFQVISAFAELQNTCLACHQAFRKPFVEHFYGRP